METYTNNYTVSEELRMANIVSLASALCVSLRPTITLARRISFH